MSGYRVVGDWGTSRLRLFRIVDGHVVDRAFGPGIGALDRPAAAVLREALVNWREAGDPDRVTLCGMVGSRNGWVETPYVDCPADSDAWRQGAVEAWLDALPVTLLPGLAGRAPSGAPEVMRGEETQLFGAMAIGSLAGAARIVLPGTHSKWATVVDGRVSSFQTFFTGELFALLRERSILTRAALPDVATGGSAGEGEGFAHGLRRAAEGVLLGGLFEARSAQLRDGRSPAWAQGYLSGLLIGREVAEATGALGDGEEVVLIGDPALCARYERALASAGYASVRLDGDGCVLAGLALGEGCC
jgi:2-dehydro-3-deoxygalactonokinase